MSDADDTVDPGEGSSVEEYTVGYGKPPLDTRWRPGQSGNPSGRKKKSRCFADELEAEANQKITVTEGGKQLQVTKMRGVIKSLFTHTYKGRVGTTRLLLEQLDRHGLTAPPPEDEDEKLEFNEEVLRLIIEKSTKLLQSRIRERELAEQESKKEGTQSDEIENQ